MVEITQLPQICNLYLFVSWVFEVFLNRRITTHKTEHVQIKERHLEILVLKSKTDKYRKSHIVHIFLREFDCCLVKTLENI